MQLVSWCLDSSSEESFGDQNQYKPLMLPDAARSCLVARSGHHTSHICVTLGGWSLEIQIGEPTNALVSAACVGSLDCHDCHLSLTNEPCTRTCCCLLVQFSKLSSWGYALAGVRTSWIGFKQGVSPVSPDIKARLLSSQWYNVTCQDTIVF
jgi:hypothetical protein